MLNRPIAISLLLMFELCVTGAWAAQRAPRPAAKRTPPPTPTPKTIPQPKPDEILPLWPQGVPNLAPGGKAEALVNERYTNVSVPQLFVYRPPQGKANGTALIICAGGGYGHLAMCLHVDNVVKLLTDRGITVFGLKYRTKYGNNNVVEDALADGQRAVRLVRARAAQWGINPRRIGVQGYSAGSNLCLNLAGHFDAGNTSSDDPIARQSCRPDFVALMCPWPNKQAIDKYPLFKDSPPTFIANARDDRTAPVEFAQAIGEKLAGLGVEHKMFIVETGGHSAFHYGAETGPGVKWPETLLPWMKKIGVMP